MKTNLLSTVNVLRAIIFTGLLLIVTNGCLLATHIVGGEITYEWISGNQYKLRLAYYRDCSGITAPGNLQISARSVSCGFTGISTVLSQSGSPVSVTPICADSISNSSCSGGSLYAVTRHLYEGILTLPGNCSDWEFYYTECCRNGAITNLVNPGTQSSYFAATLNNLDVPFNNSVQFGTIPTNIIPNNTSSSLSWNAYDVDGDSLIFELTSARGDNPPVNLVYSAGLSFQQPFIASVPTSINAANGLLVITPNAMQVNVVAMKVSEYRNGTLIGTVYRDYQIAVVNSTNSLPTLTGINGTTSFVASVCPGDTLQFDVLSDDPDAGQSLNMTMNAAGTGATLTVGAGVHPAGSVFWMPSAGDISSQPYVFTIDVNDDYCNYYGTQTYAYHIYVNGCNTNDVWPGDANSDGTANLYDLLAVGLAFNDNGPVRPSASLTWVGQPATDWTNTFTSGINHKHADTDGNGTVNSDDTTAIILNYGLNHPLRGTPAGVQNVADLSVTANYDTVGTEMAVHFDVALSTPVDSIYGLAFRMFFDPSLVDLTTTEVTYTGSVFGTNGVNMVKIDKTIGSSGFVDIALSRTDHQNISGSGAVARITIVTTDNVSGKVTLNVEPFDVEAITAYEFPVTINTNGDGVVIDPNYLGINETITAQLVSVHPIPANDILEFSFGGTPIVESLKFFDTEGREVMNIQNPSNKMNIHIQSLSKGVYYLKAVIGGNNVIKKIVKL